MGMQMIDTPPLPFWDADLIEKYSVAGPRYTSYPTADRFTDAFGEAAYLALAGKHAGSIEPLSLYLHIPFCENICYYCACNKVVTRKRQPVRQYLDHLARETAWRAKLYRGRVVMQLHLGGGTPTYLTNAELTELVHLLGLHFELTDNESREYSIEIDPRTVNADSIALLKGLGFNRASLGIQDFSEVVQQAINRIQPVSQVSDVVATLRRYGFDSINFDLIYGLPNQDVAGFDRTIDQVLTLAPERIALYNYAHLPQRFPSQRAIGRHTLPSATTRLAILQHAGSRLLEAGYEYIGMDHFVRPDDELAVARRNAALQRNFQGYSTRLAPELVGLGVSSISDSGDGYFQNAVDLEGYYSAIDHGHLPIRRGIVLTDEDRLRRDVIMAIACQLYVDFTAVETAHGIDFRSHFAAELVTLEPLAADGLVRIGARNLEVTERGQLLLRNICMAFDTHHKPVEGGQQRFSQTV